MFVGVYDGHGGSEVSGLLERHLHRHFANQLDLLEDDVENAFNQSYSIVNQSLSSKQFARIGSTAVCIYLRTSRDPFTKEIKRVLYVSNVGDSQCIVGLGPQSGKAYKETLDEISDESEATTVMPNLRPPLNMIHSPSASPFVTPTRTSKRFHFSAKNTPTSSRQISPIPLPSYRPLSYAHSGHDTSECTRIKASGGHILMDRVNGCLAVTRAFGDNHLSIAGVTANPFQFSIELTDEWVIVLACDGVWDVLNGDEVIECCRNQSNAQAMANHICESAILRGTTDNVTVIVVKLSNQGVS
jgi:serine/threonine protein phosphatase PrpC